MRHTRYRRLDQLIIGAIERPDNPRVRPQVRVRVDSGNHGSWQATTGQIGALIAKAQQLGGAVEAQRTNGDWERIYRYFTKKGVGYACGQATGRWFEAVAIREVM